MRRVAVVTGNRAEYSRLRSVLRALRVRDDVQLQLVVTGAHLLDRYGHTVDEIEADGFTVDERVFLVVEGENPVTMAKSTGLGIMELAGVFDRLRPDVVVAPTDRFETLSVAVAAAFLNIPVGHVQGGEVTGSIDESIRHAITKFAHLHFAATEGARERIVRMGEDPRHVWNVGCPATDELLRTELGTRRDLLGQINRLKKEQDRRVNEDDDYVLVVQHPVTTEYGQGFEQVIETLRAVERAGKQALALWPNADADSKNIASGIRRFARDRREHRIFIFRHVPGEVFVRLMAHATCMIGNSSAGIRESCYFGTPVVNIGSRQQGRERGRNVRDAANEAEAIEVAIREQISHGRYEAEAVYGDGTAGQRIGEILATIPLPSAQKRICY